MSRALRIIVLTVVLIIAAFVVYDIWLALKPPDDATFATVCQRHDNGVWIEGYLDYPESGAFDPLEPYQNLTYNGYDGFEFHSEPDSAVDPAYVLVFIPRNTGYPREANNSVTEFYPNDGNKYFHVVTDSGEALPQQKKVKILGSLYGYEERNDPIIGKIEKSCELTVKKILRAEP